MTESAPPADRAELYARILASTQDHLSLVSRGYVYQVVNDAYLRAHRRRRDEIEGRHVADLLGAAIFERVVKPRLDRALAGEAVEYEDWFEFRGKGRRRMSVAYFPHRMPDDERPSGVLVRATDVTGLRAVEEDLKERDARLELFFDVAKVGTWEWRIDSNELVWSERVLELFGTTRAEFGATYEAFLSLVHPADREGLERAVSRAVDDPEAGYRYETQYRIRRPDGQIRWQHARGGVLRDESGAPERMLGIVHDITAQKSLEAQLSHSQRLDAIGRLAGGVAHDFNNLLTAIIGSAEVGLRADRPQTAKESFATITTASERAATLVRSLLAFARVGTSEPRVVEVNALLRQLQRLLERLLPESIELEVVLDAAALHVLIDPGQLEQVVVNLAVNARDAMPDGGHLRIAARGEGEGAAPGVRIEVRDDGCGIPEDLLDRVREPFFTTKPPGAGSGLGLATCHGVVERAGGRLEIESAVGSGTTVSVRLPAVGEPLEPQADLIPDSQPLGAGERLLLVEDDALVRETTRLMLESLGYDVQVFGNGTEALAQLPAEPSVRVLLTDVVMPLMMGPDLARRLRAVQPDLRVVFMSGYTQDSEATVDGARWLSKPFTRADLARVLSEALSDGAGG